MPRHVNSSVKISLQPKSVFFLVYINNLTADLKCNVKLFADDTSLFTVAHEPNEAADHMNHDLELIRQWAQDWRMSFTPDPQKQPLKHHFQGKEMK